MWHMLAPSIHQLQIVEVERSEREDLVISRGSCPHRHPHLSTAIHSPKVPLVGGFKHFFYFSIYWE